MNQWFQYICEENAGQYRALIDKVMDYSYPLFGNLSKAGTVRDVAKALRDQGLAMVNGKRGNTPIVKDPIAFFSAEWLSHTYKMNVLVTIRHPAAFCSSLKMNKWDFDFRSFLEQPLLMKRYLSEYEEDIRECAQEEKGILDQAILLWNCIHHVRQIYQQDHPEWVFVRLEDLSNEPIESFRSIYNRLGLEFTPKVRSGILNSSGPHNPTEQQPGNECTRNSKGNIKNWKHRLSREEIDSIRVKTNAVSRAFYGDDEW